MRAKNLLLATALVALVTPSVAGAHGRSFRWGISVGWWPGWWYGPHWGAVRVPAGGPPDLAVVDTDISPEAALVLLDGELIGTADDFDGFPDYLYLRPGRYALELRLGGYESLTIEIEAVAGRFYRLKNKLERRTGKPVTAWFDRPRIEPVGRVFGPKSRPASGGNGREKPESGARDRGAPDVALRPELERVEQRPALAGGALQLAITPVLASVYLDGEFLGTAAELAALERGLHVAAGPHRLEIVAPGFEPREVEVEVAEGSTQQVVVELEPRGGQNRGGELH